MLSACLEKIDLSNTEGYELFITQLKEGLKNTTHETAANHKVAKVSDTFSKGAFVILFCPVLIKVYCLSSCQPGLKISTGQMSNDQCFSM